VLLSGRKRPERVDLMRAVPMSGRLAAGIVLLFLGMLLSLICIVRHSYGQHTETDAYTKRNLVRGGQTGGAETAA
jgi:hypothetical protein